MPGAYILKVEGLEVLHLDFSHCTLAQAPALLTECAALVRSRPLGSALTLSDFTGAHFDSQVTAALRDYAKANKPFVKFAAVVGVTGLKKAIFRAVLLFSGRTDLFLCATVDEARQALVRRARDSSPRSRLTSQE
jgi:hypothetical protein